MQESITINTHFVDENIHFMDEFEREQFTLKIGVFGSHTMSFLLCDTLKLHRRKRGGEEMLTVKRIMNRGNCQFKKL
jgi:uncharacterized protein YpiB (UPF0302 family)